MDAGSGYDGPSCGIPQCIAQGRDLGGHIDIQGNHMESTARVEGGEQLLNGDPQAGTTFTEQQCHLEQCDGAHPERFPLLDRAAQHANLIPREPLGFHKPANEHVSIKEKARGQSGNPLFFADGFPQIRHVGG